MNYMKESKNIRKMKYKTFLLKKISLKKYIKKTFKIFYRFQESIKKLIYENYQVIRVPKSILN